MEHLSAAEARRIALAAQGFGQRRPAAPGRRHLAAMAERLGMFQIDSVNVLTRAHTMPAFSRLGAYDMAAFEAAAWGQRRAWFEYWGHEASLIPLAAWPLLQWRMREASSGKWVYGELARFVAERTDYVDRVRAEIRDRGALAAADLDEPGAARGKWWGWSDGKRAMEYLFWAGEVTVSTRRGAFERVYDFPERVLPGEILALPVPDAAEAQRGLLRIAAAAMGVATEGDLRAYWRLKPTARPLVQDLVDAGELRPVTVEGWDKPGLLWHAAPPPRRLKASALLSPFDPMLWERDRALRLLGCHYRIGLYTPKEKRTDGYYVLPFLHGDRIVARVDLKADRQGRVLHVHAAHLEAGEAAGPTAAALIGELRAMAAWLGLGRIAVARQGDLAGALAAEAAAGA
jgi:uncharacterized protein YcaQ